MKKIPCFGSGSSFELKVFFPHPLFIPEIALSQKVKMSKKKCNNANGRSPASYGKETRKENNQRAGRNEKGIASSKEATTARGDMTKRE